MTQSPTTYRVDDWVVHYISQKYKLFLPLFFKCSPAALAKCGGCNGSDYRGLDRLLGPSDNISGRCDNHVAFGLFPGWKISISSA